MTERPSPWTRTSPAPPLSFQDLGSTEPVIILTTTEDPREVDRCHELGCNVYIHKPVSYESFQHAITQLGKFVSLVKVPQLKPAS